MLFFFRILLFCYSEKKNDLFVVCPVSLYFDLLGQNTKNRNKKDLSDPFLFRKEKGFAFFLSFCRVTSNGHTTKGKAKRRKE
jgi:hypothetical protein